MALQCQSLRIFSILDYDAKIDGNTDDTTAVLGAIADAKNAGGGIVWNPGGGPDNPAAKSIISQTLLLDSGVILAGPNPRGYDGAGYKMENGANLDAVVCSRNWYENTLTGGTASGIQGICLDANTAGQTSGIGHGFVTMTYRAHIQDAMVKNSRSAGILLTSVCRDGVTEYSTQQVSEMRCIGNTVKDPGTHGIYLHEGVNKSRVTDGFMLYNIVDASGLSAGNNGHGIFMEQCGGWLIEGNHPYHNGKDAMRLQNCADARIIGNYPENWGFGASVGNVYGLWVQAGLRGPIVVGNQVHGYPANMGAGNTPIGIHFEDQNSASTQYGFFSMNFALAATVAGTGIELTRLGSGTFALAMPPNSNQSVGWSTNWSVGAGVNAGAQPTLT